MQTYYLTTSVARWPKIMHKLRSINEPQRLAPSPFLLQLQLHHFSPSPHFRPPEMRTAVTCRSA